MALVSLPPFRNWKSSISVGKKRSKIYQNKTKQELATLGRLRMTRRSSRRCINLQRLGTDTVAFVSAFSRAWLTRKFLIWSLCSSHAQVADYVTPSFVIPRAGYHQASRIGLHSNRCRDSVKHLFKYTPPVVLRSRWKYIYRRSFLCVIDMGHCEWRELRAIRYIYMSVYIKAIPYHLRRDKW